MILWWEGEEERGGGGGGGKSKIFIVGGVKICHVLPYNQYYKIDWKVFKSVINFHIERWGITNNSRAATIVSLFSFKLMSIFILMQNCKIIVKLLLKFDRISIKPTCMLFSLLFFFLCFEKKSIIINIKLLQNMMIVPERLFHRFCMNTFPLLLKYVLETL
jgi:hypothetical protein